ncbi:MAG TPA: hypothetical protein VGG61_13325, partial [Gemmataceae bacterium]
MRRCFAIFMACTLTVGLAAGSAGCSRAGESPFTGNWTIRILLPGQEADVFLVEIKDVDGKLEGKVLSAGIPGFEKDAKFDHISADGDKTLRLTVSGGGQTFPAVLHAPKGEAKADKLLGSVQFRGRQFVRLDRTDLKKLDPEKAITNVPSMADFGAALRKA